jgi:hypothetical protein
MMSNNVQPFGEHVTAALLGRLTPRAQRWRSWLAPAVRLVMRRRRRSSTVSPARPGPGVLVSTIGAFRPGDALTTVPETLRLMLDVNLGDPRCG